MLMATNSTEKEVERRTGVFSAARKMRLRAGAGNEIGQERERWLAGGLKFMC